MAQQDIFRIRGLNPSTTVPAYGGSGIAASTYAKNDPDCAQATILDADDINFLLDNIRRTVTGCGIDIEPVEVLEDPTLLLRAVQQCVTNGAVAGGNQAQAYSDNFLLPENQLSVINVLANDNFDNRDQLSVTKINSTAVNSGDTVAVANGSVRIRSDGLIEFTPTTDFTGVTAFLYEATDLSGVVSAALANITVFDVPDPVPEPTLEIIAARWASVSWTPPAWSQMTPFSAAELAAAIDGNTVNRARLISGAGNVSWLAFEVNMPIVLKTATFHPAGVWKTGQFRNVGPYYNMMLGSDDGETFGIIHSSTETSNASSYTANVIDTAHTGGNYLAGTYGANVNNWRTYKDASVQRTKFMRAFNFADGAESADLSNIGLVV